MTRKCKHCQQPLVQRTGESVLAFQQRKFCGTVCIIREARACQPLPVLINTEYAQKLAEAQQLAREALKGWRK